jgi:hypothetical protein
VIGREEGLHGGHFSSPKMRKERTKHSQIHLHCRHGYERKGRFLAGSFPIGKDHSGKEWQDAESGHYAQHREGRLSRWTFRNFLSGENDWICLAMLGGMISGKCSGHAFLGKDAKNFNI